MSSIKGINKNQTQGIKSANSVLSASFFLAEEEDLQHMTNNNILNNNNEPVTTAGQAQNAGQQSAVGASPVSVIDSCNIVENSSGKTTVIGTTTTGDTPTKSSIMSSTKSRSSPIVNAKSVVMTTPANDNSNHVRNNHIQSSPSLSSKQIPQVQFAQFPSDQQLCHTPNCGIITNLNYQNQVKGQDKKNIETLKKLLNDPSFDLKTLSDDELILLVKYKEIPLHRLESLISDAERSVRLRRDVITQQLAELDIEGAIDNLPYEDFNYDIVFNACCENVIGYVQVPVGKAGPLLLDGKSYYVPMATTEGCLVASTSRGFSALFKCGGVISNITKDEMTRAPVVRIRDMLERKRAICWLEKPESRKRLTEAFNSTSDYAKLVDFDTVIVGDLIFIRFSAKTGDAMGMNMLSKGSEKALEEMKKEFPTIEVVSLSGNYCTDKKPAAVNWIRGRGKSVCCDAILAPDVVQTVLKVSVDALYDIWINKVMIGSAIAGSIGGFNCQAANIVTAIYIATGQDPAQNITSSNCIITMEKMDEGKLHVSCTMPSIECGTVGGGTILAAQGACLKMMGIQGPSKFNAGENAQTLARIVCASVMAGELSLLAAFADGTLVKSHMRHNRSRLNVLANGK